MFSHLELTFDLHEGKVTTETAAKDAHGEPYHKHVLDLKTDASLSFTGTEVTAYRPSGQEVVPVAPTAPVQVAPTPMTAQPVHTAQPVQPAAPAYDETNPYEFLKYREPGAPYVDVYDWRNPDEWKKYLKPAAPEAAVANEWKTHAASAYPGHGDVANNNDIANEWKNYMPADYAYDYSGSNFAEAGIDGDNDMKVLTIEEQREVAFKVVFFFIGLIAASFGVLYIYHRMTQANIKSVREKQTL